MLKVASFTLDATTPYKYEEAVEKIIELFKEEGFGLVTQMDMKKNI